MKRSVWIQYSDTEWEKVAGNGYMYMKRMRHDGFLDLFRTAAREVLGSEPDTGQYFTGLLEDRAMRLDGRFVSKSLETLSIRRARIVPHKATQNHARSGDASAEGASPTLGHHACTPRCSLSL
jgi:hypothetical protein